MAVRLISVGSVTLFDAGTLIYPFTYLIGNVLTDLYGFRTTRRVIFQAFFCEMLFTFICWVATLLPYPIENAEMAEAYAHVFGFVPRIMGASLFAFLLGELTNAWIFQKIKKRTQGKHLWVRTIGSTLCACILDTVGFVLIAFVGIVPTQSIISMILIQIVAKLTIEICASTPAAYALLGYLRKQLK